MGKNNSSGSLFTTTVYTLKTSLKENSLTRFGYYDLIKIKNLRIYDNGFLKILRTRFNLNQKQMAYKLNVSLRTFIGWEYYGKCLPFEKLNKLRIDFNIGEVDFFGLIKDTQFTYGSHHGKNKVKLPLRHEEFYLHA
mgnify:FL=1